MRRLILGVLALGFGTPSCLALVDFQESCLADSDCPVGSFCRGSQCTTTCDETSDCGNDRVCDPSSHRCQDLPACSSTNASVVCGSYACNSSAGRCYQDCRGPNLQRAPAQCNDTAVCTYDFTCRPPCIDTYDVTCAPFLCDTIMGWCSDFCIEDVDCADGYSCRASTCEP